MSGDPPKKNKQPSKALVIINRKSKNGKKIDAGIIRSHFKNNNIEPHIEDSEEPSQIPGMIEQKASGFNIIVLAGGDGTLNRASRALVKAGLPLGLIPSGTANDLARTLGIPSDVEKACEIIVNRKVHTIDVGSVNDKLFFNIAHVGLGTKILEIAAEKKKKWGILSYFYFLSKAFGKTKKFRLKALYDDNEEELDSIQFSVANGRYFARIFPIDQSAKIDDNKLQAVNIAPHSLKELIFKSPYYFLADYQNLEKLHRIETKKIEITTDKQLSIAADGEIIAETPAEFRVLPRIITIFIPEDY